MLAAVDASSSPEALAKACLLGWRLHELKGDRAPLMEEKVNSNTPPGPMHSPPHPGALVREDVLKEMGMTVTRAAGLLGVNRSNLSQFLNERQDVTPELVLKLEACFGLEAAMMLRMQMNHNLAKARSRQAEITANVRRAERVTR